MHAIKLKTKHIQTVFALCALLALTACATPNQQHLTYTGQVFDIDTKQPIEGAYVLAEYREGASNWAHSSSWCIATKGMTTGADGKFSFPALESNKQMPLFAYAIKPDYFYASRDIASSDSQHRANQDAFSNQNIYLKKQDKAKPEFQHGFNSCGTRPESIDAVQAAKQFMEIELAEMVKFQLGNEFTETQKSRIATMLDIASKQTQRNTQPAK
jgi:hypothetical protein